MESTIRINQGEYTITDAMIVNPHEFDPAGRWHQSYTNKPFLFTNYGTPIAIVFARTDQDAIDELIDAGRLDNWKSDDEECRLAQEENEDSECYCLIGGNASEHFNQDGFELIELPIPAFSFVAQFANTFPENVIN